MSLEIVKISDNFWNIRGSFKIGGIIDIGTHASLIKKANGEYVFLDSIDLKGQALDQVNALTNNGEGVSDVLNLHPFHTIHVERMHNLFPNARHYATSRHHELFPKLNWQKLKTEDKKLHEKFSEDFDFSIPQGVDFISHNKKIHFSSVLAYHRSSKTIHVDDTLMYIDLPKILNYFGMSNPISFHPTLSQALQPNKNAASEFQEWAQDLAQNWSDAKNLCTAHTSYLTRHKSSTTISKSILKALQKVQSKLARHQKKYL